MNNSQSEEDPWERQAAVNNQAESKPEELALPPATSVNPDQTPNDSVQEVDEALAKGDERLERE